MKQIQSSIQELTNDQIGNSILTANNMYECCNICHLNQQYCNVFVFDESNLNCKQYALVNEAKHQGTLNPYNTFNVNSVVGGFISDI